jgi:hypothetical protein
MTRGVVSTDSTQLQTHWLTYCFLYAKLSVIQPNIHPTHISFWRNSPQWARASSFMRFLDHTQRRITVGRTPLDEWCARRRDLYLAIHNTQQTDFHIPGGIRTQISTGERPPTYALDRAVTRTGKFMYVHLHIYVVQAAAWVYIQLYL